MPGELFPHDQPSVVEREMQVFPVKGGIADDTYAIPKSAVDHVDHIDSSAALASNSAGTQLTPSLAAPKINSGNLNQVAPDGKITPDRLAHIEAAGNKSTLVSALILLAI